MRILITGLAGAGKTTLARVLSQEIGAPLHDFDDLVWSSNGLASIEDRLSLGEEIARKEKWIVDGYIGWTAPIVEAADVIVVMQVPARTALWRIFWRHFMADLRRNNRHPGWRRLCRFMSTVAQQYRSKALPENEREPYISQLAIECTLKPHKAKVLINPTVAQVLNFNIRNVGRAFD